MKAFGILCAISLAILPWVLTVGHAYNNPECRVEERQWVQGGRSEIVDATSVFCLATTILPVGWPFYWAAHLQKR